MVWWFALVIVLVAAGASPWAQSDLDALMARVLAQRDANWKKLQQYVLNERETLHVTGPAGQRVYGFDRDYLWYPRDGRFVKSPVSADGVRVSDEVRARFEEQWIERQARRERRKGGERGGAIQIAPDSVSVDLPDGDALEPGFVATAYFLNFTFEPGRYALVGREPFNGRDTLRIEYYPSRLFTEGRTRPNRELRRRDDRIEEKMNKVSLVTLWVLPEEHQVVRYTFEQIDMDFMPAQHLVRLDGGTATMEMGQPFPGVWLPKSLTIGFEATTAAGELTGRYSSEYHDYRLADVAVRIR